jgi:hypothetical protein
MAEYDGALAYGSGAYGSGPYIDSYSQIRETTAVDKTLISQPPPVFTGMKLQADILLGDLVLNTIDENNVVWVCTDIEGWWAHPDPEVPDIIRGWGDGSYDASGRWAARCPSATARTTACASASTGAATTRTSIDVGLKLVQVPAATACICFCSVQIPEYCAMI